MERGGKSGLEFCLVAVIGRSYTLQLERLGEVAANLSLADETSGCGVE